RITLKKSFLPRKSKMASPYPAAAETRVDTSAPPTAYSAVFPAQRRNSPSRKAKRSRRFSSRYVEGANVKVEKSSSALFEAANSTQRMGMRPYSAPRTRTPVATSEGFSAPTPPEPLRDGGAVRAARERGGAEPVG